MADLARLRDGDVVLDTNPVEQVVVFAIGSRGSSLLAQGMLRVPAPQLEKLSQREQEAPDLGGWGYVLWHRTQMLAAKLTGKLEVPSDG